MADQNAADKAAAEKAAVEKAKADLAAQQTTSAATEKAKEQQREASGDAPAELPKARREKKGEDTATKKYRLRAGDDIGAHYENGEQLEPGDVVELTERQFKAFGDKFEAV